MKIRINCFCLIVLFASSFARGQQEAANWYFGDKAGINFADGSLPIPLALTDGVLSTPEGCSSISNINGNLLFYTDGVEVYNRQHLKMPNGDGLLGSSTSTQSALIVPNTSNADIYYVFTVDKADSNDATNGLNYSVVDMALDNGLGDVVNGQKNINLLPATTEKVSAVKHTTRNSFWVLTCDKNKSFHAYEVTNLGSVNAPVISPFSGSINDGRGYLKISPGGNYVAIANYSDETAYFYRFDADTGRLRLEQSINVDSGYLPYGVEFSSDSRFLYISAYSPTEDRSRIYQYNSQDTGINDSRVVIVTDDLFRGALQIGIDGKIYRAQPDTNYLGVINNPNEPGLLCDYNSNVVLLESGISQEGLPPFVQSFFVLDIQVEDNCFGEPTVFTINSNQNIIDITWDFGDPSSGINNSSDLQNPSHLYTNNGTFIVEATVTFEDLRVSTFVKEVTVFPTPIANIPDELNICFTDIAEVEVDIDQQTASILANQDPDFFTVSYHSTSEDAENNISPLSFIYSPTSTLETIYARIQNRFTRDCFDITSFDIVLNQINPIAIEDQINLCPGGTVTVDAFQAAAASYNWSNNETGSSTIIGDIGMYAVEIIFTNGCSVNKEFEVVHIPPPEILAIEVNEDSAQIVVESNSPVVYSLDNSLFQNSNTFNLLPPGVFTIYVKDVNGCSLITEEFVVLGFSKFFTPNNDGFNDLWDISSLSFLPNSQVSIFNRYGQLLKTLIPDNSVGWDGTFEGILLPASDYWFKVNLQDGRELKGHFALKR